MLPNLARLSHAPGFPFLSERNEARAVNGKRAAKTASYRERRTHCLYSCCFVGAWCLAFLAIPLVPLFVVLALTSSAPVTTALVIALAVLLVAFASYASCWPGIKHQIRAGVFPLSLCDAFPSTEKELRDAFLRVGRQTGHRARTVSHGWSFYLAKLRATGPRVWTLRFTGRLSNGRWKSGTTIKEVARTLAREDLALPHGPTMEFASLGSWIATCSHGHPGAVTEMREWLSSARVLNLETGRVTDDAPSELLDKFGSTTSDVTPEDRYVILDVKINSVRNATLRRTARVMRTVADANWWLRATHIRLMFIGTAGPLGVVWNEFDKSAQHPNIGSLPRRCSAFAFWLLVDCLPTLPCAAIDNVSRFDAVSTLSGANGDVNPSFPPIMSIWGQMCCIYNLELILPWDLDAPQLARLAAELEKFHKFYYGRTELRVDRKVVYLDISAGSVQKLNLYMSMLYMTQGVRHAAQHLGKYRLQSLSPLVQLSVAEALQANVMQGFP